MKVIDLLNKIANGEEVPLVKCRNKILHWNKERDRFEDKDVMNTLYEIDFSELNDEVEILEEEKKGIKPLTKKDLETLGYACGEIKKCIEKGFNKSLNNEPLEDDDKDIPLIPDDELYVFKGDSRELNYNFKVLQEKINQVIKEFNEYRKENE